MQKARPFTKHITRHILTICAVLAMVSTGILFSFGSIFGSPAQSSLASSISSFTEYAAPGADPWGTAFDGSGRVWVALPGCDFAPSCPSSTPPGKLALFDPAMQSWVTVVALPAGYGQPIFVAVDKNGKIWFTMPVTNAIAKYDPVASTVTQWAVPTPGAGPWGIAEEFANKLAEAIQGSSTPTPTSTATSTPTPTGTATSTPTPTSTPGSTLGTDTFQRANQSLWGTASDGQTWGG